MGKRSDQRSFGFRMPGAVFDDLAAVARARGTDVSAIINWAISLIHPRLVKERAEHEAALLEAAKSKAWEDAETPEERLAHLRKLLRALEDEEDALAKQVRGDGKRRSA